MVITVSIVSVGRADLQAASDLATYYVTDSDKSGQRTGRWYGRVATALNLEGMLVSQGTLQNLFLAKSPDGLSQLVTIRVPNSEAAPQESKQVAKEPDNEPEESRISSTCMELTFSLPESVIALWAVGDDRVPRIIENCFKDAITERLECFETELTRARPLKDSDTSTVSGLVFALFIHTTARNHVDPQLHSHVVMLNLSHGNDGQWSKMDGCLNASWMYVQAMLFRNSLLKNLSDRLGVEAYVPVVNGKRTEWFQLKGVPMALFELWSSRRTQILHNTELTPGIGSAAEARENANLRTRKSQGESGLDEATQREEWKKEANRQGFTSNIVQSVLNRHPRIDVEERVNQAVIAAARKCTDDQPYFTRLKFIQRVSEELLDVPISGNEVIKKAEAALKSEQYVEVRHEKSDRVCYTTKEMRELEKRTLADIQTLRECPGAKVSRNTIDSTLKKYHELSPEQASAAQALLEDQSSLRTMTGDAGAGKITTLKVVAEALRAEGYKVLGRALSRAAREELASKAGIRTETLASYSHKPIKAIRQKIKEWVIDEARTFVRALQGEDQRDRAKLPTLGKETVMILDESAMVDSRTLALLVREATKKGVTLLMVGDQEQLSPIGPGGPFLQITKDGATCHLSGHFRQRNSPEDSATAASPLETEVEAILENYARRGCLTVTQTRTDAVTRLVNEWVKDGGIAKPKGAMILTQTRADANQINTLCQDARLLKEAISSKSVVIQNQVYHVGDRVMFHQKIGLKGVKNGDQGTISGIDRLKKTVAVMLDRKPTKLKAMMGQKQTVTIAIDNLSEKHLTLGYAATPHKIQGQRIERIYCLSGGGIANKKLDYVQLTRGESFTKVFMDRDVAGKKLADIADSMQQSGKKDLAHDRLDENRLRLRISRDDKGK